ISVWAPDAIAGHPSDWAGVGSSKARVNHSRVSGLKGASASTLPIYRRASGLLAAVDEVEDQSDRHEHGEDEADEERDARQRDQRRARAATALGLGGQVPGRLDGMHRGARDVLHLFH